MARWRHLPPNDQGRFRASLDRVITKHRRREGNPVSPLRPFQRRCCRRQGDKRPTGMRPRKFDKFVKCLRRSGVDLSPSVREDFSKLLAQRSQSRQVGDCDDAIDSTRHVYAPQKTQTVPCDPSCRELYSAETRNSQSSRIPVSQGIDAWVG